MAMPLLHTNFVRSRCLIHIQSLKYSILALTSSKSSISQQLGFRKHFICTTKNLRRPSSVSWTNRNDAIVPTMVSWLMPTLQNFDSQSIIDRLPRLNTADKTKSLTTVFLVTPSLAHLLDQIQFLELALKHIHGSSWSSMGHTEIKSIASVVDKIPGPPIDSTSLTGKLTDFGGAWEGLALLIAPDSQFVKTEHNGVQGNDLERISTLQLSPQIGKEDASAEANSCTWSVTLPVANTLFVNGRRSTLFEDNWSPSISDASSTPLVLKHLARMTLKSLEIVIPKQSSKFLESFVPLESLTQPRRVVSAMGNVVREIDIDGKPKPASTELEAAVIKFIRGPDGGLAREKPEIYALVTPTPLKSRRQGAMSIDEVGLQAKSGELTREMTDSIWEGARLYRVTGGGGGWGKKQGLLSLDPSLDLDGFEASSSISENLDGELISFSTKANQLLEQGSTVEFFASVNPQSDTSAANGTNPDQRQSMLKANPSEILTNQQIIFGCIPRQDIPNEPSPATTQAQGDLVCLDGHFGVLSESGLAVASEEVQSTDDTSVEASKGPQVLARSRIDVPFTLLRANFGKAGRAGRAG